MFREWLSRWLAPEETAEAPLTEGEYERGGDGNITAVIAGKLAMLTCGDSTIEGGGGVTADALGRLWRRSGTAVTARAFGTGGTVLVPLVHRGHVDVAFAAQSRLKVYSAECGRISRAELAADRVRENGEWYTLMMGAELTDEGARICCEAVRDGGERVPLGRVSAWSGLARNIELPGAEHLPFTLLKCPADPRRGGGPYGVPVTFGARAEIEELKEHMRVYRREFKLTRPMLGLDASLWRENFDLMDIKGIRRCVQDQDDPFVPFNVPAIDGSGVWQYYAPPIRQEAMEQRQRSLCRRVERACGLSEGILTERSGVSYANKDEIRGELYDTFCVVNAMRRGWEEALSELADSIKLLCDAYGLDAGRGDVRFDWDTSLLESSSQTFEQLTALYDRKLIGGDALVKWVTGARGGDVRAQRGAGRCTEVNGESSVRGDYMRR